MDRTRGVDLRRIAYALASVWYAGLFYGNTLKKKPPDRMLAKLTSPWPGDAARGAAILRGEFEFAGHAEKLSGLPWATAAPEAWRAELHRFDWLADLAVVGDKAAHAKAQELTASWIGTQMRWRPLSWRPDILAARISNWLTHMDFLAGDEFEPLVIILDSAARQGRHLRRSAPLARNGAERFTIAQGLVLLSLCVPGERLKLKRGLDYLKREIAQQILQDGGLVERSPSRLFAALKDLVAVRGALRDADAVESEELQNAIDRMTPMLRFFRHGDGGLALFNGSAEEAGPMIDVTLSRAEARGKPLTEAVHSGFQRITASRTLVLMDTGAPAPPGWDREAHAGTLSFEMSVGKERLIVNCGALPSAGPEWRAAQRASAAHSTVTVEDMNSAELLREGLGARPHRVKVARREADGNVWIEAEQDGYHAPFGIMHKRRLYLAADGGDLRGEDALSGSAGRKFAVRFHLHPLVQASPVQGGSAVLLRLPGGVGWRFRAQGGPISVQESIYLGGGAPKRTDQIVITGATERDGAVVKWAFTRVAS